MRRVVLAISIALLVGGLGWAVAGRERVEDRAARLALELDRSTERVARLRADLRAAEHLAKAEITAEQRAKRDWRRRYVERGWELNARRAELRRLHGLRSVFAPRPGSVWMARLLASVDDTGLLVVGLNHKVQIWRLAPADAAGAIRAQWWLVYEITATGTSSTIRTSAGLTTDPFAIAGVGTAATGDLTNDGLPDIVIHGTNTGTGGCGVVRVLENGADLRQIYRRADCENFVDVEDGLLVYSDAREPKWCKLVHGCGTRTTWRRWDGSSWDVVRTRLSR